MAAQGDACFTWFAMHLSAVIVLGPNQAEECRIAMGRQSAWGSVLVELVSYAVGKAPAGTMADCNSSYDGSLVTWPDTHLKRSDEDVG